MTNPQPGRPGNTDPAPDGTDPRTAQEKQADLDRKVAGALADMRRALRLPADH